ncbi:MAG TPA: response regulator transcription factor [Chloroflexota bacterium]|nr:response regulator transcription factor [Chloroflexota bacterium]
MDILVVDDDPDIVDIISYSLRKDGHQVIAGHDGQEALDLARKYHPDLAILDVMMPRQNGFEVCRRLRQEGSIPVILLTAKGEEADKVWGLDLGADDYITKPFSHKELLARVRAVGRRALASGVREAHGSLEAGPLCMDLDQHELRIAERVVDLTPKEFELLRCLLLNSGKVVSHDSLLNFAWGANAEGDTEMLKVHVRHLREKIERNPSAPEYVLTVRGIGYKLGLRG